MEQQTVSIAKAVHNPPPKQTLLCRGRSDRRSGAVQGIITTLNARTAIIAAANPGQSTNTRGVYHPSRLTCVGADAAY